MHFLIVPITLLSFLISCHSKINRVSTVSDNSQAALWSNSSVSETTINTPPVLPEKFRVLKLNSELMKKKLSAIHSNDSGIVIEMPVPEGGFIRFEITEVSTVDASLLEKYPHLRTYSGKGLDEPGATGRFDFTSGFHGYLFTLSGSVIINMATKEPSEYYICYYKHDSNQIKRPFEFDADSVKHRE